MIREADVRAAVESLPDSCWLKHYVRYAETQVASHIGFHVAMGLSMIGAATPRDFVGEGFKRPTFTNFYCLIVGKSGDAEKTIAMDVGLDMMSDAAPHLIAGDPVSELAMLRALEASPSCLFPYPEVATFLANTMGKDNSRGQAIRAQLTSIFDGRSISKPYSKEENNIVVTDPRVNFIGACTPQHLEELTVRLDWEGGLISRFFVVYGDRERQMPWPTPNPELRTWLVRWLAASATHPNTATCLGLEPDAAALWLWWFEDIIARNKTAMSNETLVGIASRSRLQAAKLATSFCWSSGLGWDVTKPWRVPLWAVQSAIAFVDLQMASVSALVDRIQPSHDMRQQRTVLNAVGEDWTPLGAITKTAKVDVRDAKRHLATLTEQGDVTVTTNDGRFFYRKSTGELPTYVEPEVLPPPPAFIPGAN